MAKPSGELSWRESEGHRERGDVVICKATCNACPVLRLGSGGPSLRTPPCLRRARGLLLGTEQVGPCGLAARGWSPSAGIIRMFAGVRRCIQPHAQGEVLGWRLLCPFHFALGPCPEAAPVLCDPSHSVPGSSTTVIHGCPGRLLLRVWGCVGMAGERITHTHARARAHAGRRPERAQAETESRPLPLGPKLRREL